MANPFPPPNVYNGQYAPHSFYPPYSASPAATSTNSQPPFAQGSQPPPAFPVTASNAKRFEANSHVPTPPIPFQLPHGWNPDVLKQLAASSNIQFPGPLPPPPPPPPPQLFASSFPPNLHASQSTALPGQPPFSQLQHVRPPFHSPRPPAVMDQINVRDTQGASGSQETQAAMKQPYESQNSRGTVRNVEGPGPVQAVVQPMVEGTSHVTHHPTSQQNINKAALASIERDEGRPVYEDLHSRAKMAITQCLPVGASYDFWLENGVKRPIIDKLFDELNLNRPPLTPMTSTEPVQSAHSGVRNNAAVGSQSIADVASATNIAQPEKLDPAMERKDRIARLLAAKKGQPLASAKSSQSASPAPADPVPKPLQEPGSQAKQHIASESTPLKLTVDQNTRKSESPSSADAQAPPTASTIDQINLPTPVREEMQRQGFSIPGLFMTSADTIEQGIARAVPEIDIETTPDSPKQPYSSILSQKRSAEPLPLHVLPQVKRQASQTMQTAEDVDMTSATTIKPTNVRSGSPPKQSNVEIRDIPTSSEGEKPVDSIATTPKSKINQDKLKDRMAALKADLLRKNSRKKALQDGMPVLDAEVAKTRDRLQEQRDRLLVVQESIDAKIAELEDAQQEKQRLLEAIQQLEHQLADGESGQKQFSRELNNLNSEISAEEKVSTIHKNAIPNTAISHDSERPAEDTLVDSKASDRGVDMNDLHGEHPSRTEFSDTERQNEQPMEIENEDLPDAEEEHSPEDDDLDRQLNADIAAAAEHSQDRDPSPFTHEDGEALDTSLVAATQPLPATQPSTIGTNSVSLADDDDDDDSDDDRMSIDEASDDDSSGSASMSDSASDDYEPTINAHSIAAANITEENEDYEPAEAATPYEEPTEPENDEYEPAEQVDIINVDTLENHEHGQPSTSEARFSPTSDYPAEYSAEPSPLEEAPAAPIFAAPSGPADQNLTSGPNTDDELTQRQERTMNIPDPLILPLSESEQRAAIRFMPYQSPLSNFKSFRFHPQFNELVKNGYRSLTYSNNIDAKKPLCSTELEGNMCTDINCIDQHFGSMALSDDKILVQMSSANDLKDKQQRDDYLLGLKKVIAGLRGQGVKEFGEVANALSKYRREWLQRQDGIVT